MKTTTPAALAALLAGLAAARCSMHDPPPEATRATVAAAGAGHPTAAVDAATGAIYVAWVGRPDAGGRADVYLARSDDGGRSYTAPVRVNDVPGDAAPHAQAPAQVAAGHDGAVYVAWQNNTRIEGRRFPASDLRLARSADGGRSFEPAVYVNDDAGGPPASHTFHDLAVLPDGTVLVSWIDGRARTAAADGGPGSGSAARAGSRAAGDRGAAHGDGRHAAATDPGPQIRVARSTDGARSFGASIVVAEGACPCCRTALAVGPDGAVYLAWRAVFAGDVRDIVVARSDDGGRSFYPARPVHHDGWSVAACPHAGPALAVDAGGRLHVAWYTGREGAAGVFHTTSSDGGRSFGEPAALAHAGVVPPSLVRMGAGPAGRVWIAWEDRTGPERRLRIGHATGARAPVALGIALDGAAAPAVAAGAGTIAVAWLDGDAVRAIALREAR